VCTGRCCGTGVHLENFGYNLTDIQEFPGGYAQGRHGATVGNTGGAELWLKNSHGVVLHLKAETAGLALSLGSDTIYIDLE